MAYLRALLRYNLAVFHSVLKVSYAYQVGFTETRQGFFGITYPKPHVMLSLLMGQYRGLLPTAPVLLVAPLGLLLLWRNVKPRRHCLILVAVPLYYYLLNASYVNWYGGWCYGPRYLSAGLFFLAPALAIIWTHGANIVRAFLVVLSGAGFWLSLIAVSTCPLPNAEWMRPIPHLVRAFAAGQIPLYTGTGTNAGTFFAGLFGIASLIPLLITWLVAIIVGALFVSGKACPRICRGLPRGRQEEDLHPVQRPSEGGI